MVPIGFSPAAWLQRTISQCFSYFRFSFLLFFICFLYHPQARLQRSRTTGLVRGVHHYRHLEGLAQKCGGQIKVNPAGGLAPSAVSLQVAPAVPLLAADTLGSTDPSAASTTAEKRSRAAAPYPATMAPPDLHPFPVTSTPRRGRQAEVHTVSFRANIRQARGAHLRVDLRNLLSQIYAHKMESHGHKTASGLHPATCAQHAGSAQFQNLLRQAHDCVLNFVAATSVPSSKAAVNCGENTVLSLLSKLCRSFCQTSDRHYNIWNAIAGIEAISKKPSMIEIGLSMILSH